MVTDSNGGNAPVLSARMPRTLGLAACLVALFSFALLHCSSSSSAGPGDAGCLTQPDAPNGKTSMLSLAVSDTAFSPSMLAADNNSTVTLTLTNTGTKPHGFAADCLATPNDRGCATSWCFPDASVIAPIAPDASATTTFVMPNEEGTYAFGSSAPGDTMIGQFVSN
jgi:hypothetical protein